MDVLEIYRNREEFSHAQRTSALLARLIRELRHSGQLEVHYTHEQEACILYAAVLHDLGKIMIPDSILLKPGSLSQSEYSVIKLHTMLGVQLTENFLELTPQQLSFAKTICMHHHEKWDGSGYPDGLAGKDIPYPARLMAVVDVYDALTHTRPYKAPYPEPVALSILKAGQGTQFDPVIVEAFTFIVPTEKAYNTAVNLMCASTL
ncbi:HD domain-containing phosphohydrolase (plasmid) [Oscillospiraceae bacterium MB08-C2-2]|nr:HD domain-containing phosphohydrolase [Oscillospiraceae bacterium MB08-C2-2]